MGGDPALPPLTKDIALEYVRRHPYWFYHGRYMFEQGPLAKEYAYVPSMVDDQDIAMAAVQDNGRVLEYLPYQLQDDFEVALAAVTNDGTAMHFIGRKLMGNKEIQLAAVTQNGLALQNIHHPDRDVVLAAVRQNGLALQFSVGSNWDQWDDPRGHYADDDEIVFAAYMQNPNSLRYASARLKDGTLMKRMKRERSRTFLLGARRWENRTEEGQSIRGVDQLESSTALRDALGPYLKARFVDVSGN